MHSQNERSRISEARGSSQQALCSQHALFQRTGHGCIYTCQSEKGTGNQWSVLKPTFGFVSRQTDHWLYDQGVVVVVEEVN